MFVHFSSSFLCICVAGAWHQRPVHPRQVVYYRWHLSPLYVYECISILLFIYLCVCMHICVYVHLCSDVCGGQKKAPVLRELEFEAVVNYPTWVLGTKPGCWVISPASIYSLKNWLYGGGFKIWGSSSLLCSCAVAVFPCGFCCFLTILQEGEALHLPITAFLFIILQELIPYPQVFVLKRLLSVVHVSKLYDLVWF